MEIEIKECPFCHSNEFIDGKQSGYGQIYGAGIKSHTVYLIICRNCGSIVRSYVKEPEKLLKRKDRRK